MKYILRILHFITFLILYIGVAGIIATTWIRSYFGPVEWEQILLNLAQPMDGLDIGIIISGFIIIGICGLVISFIAAKLLYKYLKQYASIGYILLGISCAVYPIHQWHLIDFILTKLITGTLYETEHVQSKIKANGRNLIFIVMEAYEKSFQNAEILEQNLSPGLTQIQSENISFKGYHQLRQTGWTITSLMSSFCGVPLKLNNMFVDLSTYATFIPGLPCWPSQLVEQGYETVMMKAANIQFTGTDKFALQHGFKKAVGYRELKSQYGSNKTTQWGLHDNHLYRAVKDELNRLSKLNKPFILTTVQADTHQPTGFINETCTPKYNDFRDAILCSDKEATDLIRWIQQQPFYENTTIVVMGDHLLSTTNIDTLMKKIPNREIYLTIINPAQNRTPYSHEFTNLDIAPTILDALGFEFNGKYGLGRSLFRAEKTLFETKKNQLEFELDCYSPKYESWGNTLPPTIFEKPDTLKPIPLGESISFVDGLNVYLALSQMNEPSVGQIWTTKDTAAFKFKPNLSNNETSFVTLRMIVPMGGASQKTIKLTTAGNNPQTLFEKTYTTFTIAEEKFEISPNMIEDEIIHVNVNIITSGNKRHFSGIQFLDIRLN